MAFVKNWEWSISQSVDISSAFTFSVVTSYHLLLDIKMAAFISQVSQL